MNRRRASALPCTIGRLALPLVALCVVLLPVMLALDGHSPRPVAAPASTMPHAPAPGGQNPQRRVAQGRAGLAEFTSSDTEQAHQPHPHLAGALAVPSTPAALRGCISDAAGNPLGQVAVRLGPWRNEHEAWRPATPRRATTDASGCFEFPGLEPGAWALAWTGAEPAVERVQLCEGQQLWLALASTERRHPGASLSGRLRDLDGAPVAAVPLTLRSGGMTIARTSSGVGGRFEFTDLAPGPAQLAVHPRALFLPADGRPAQIARAFPEFQVDVGRGKSVVGDLVVERPTTYSVQGRLRFVHGLPPSPEAHPWRVSIESAAEGAASLETNARGSHALVLDRAGHFEGGGAAGPGHFRVVAQRGELKVSSPWFARGPGRREYVEIDLP